MSPPASYTRMAPRAPAGRPSVAPSRDRLDQQGMGSREGALDVAVACSQHGGFVEGRAGSNSGRARATDAEQQHRQRLDLDRDAIGRILGHVGVCATTTATGSPSAVSVYAAPRQDGFCREGSNTCAEGSRNRPEECRPYPRRSVPPTPRGAPARAAAVSIARMRPCARGEPDDAHVQLVRKRDVADEARNRSRSPARRLRGEGRTRQARPAVRIFVCRSAFAPVSGSHTRIRSEQLRRNNSSTRSRRWQTPCSWA